MRICVPLQDDRGLQAPVNAHFGSAPYFLIHDTGTGQSVLLPNGEEAHAHAQCHPLQSIASQQVDVVLCSGTGGRALDLLQQAGLHVCLASAGTADGAIRAHACPTRPGRRRPATQLRLSPASRSRHA